MIRKRVAIFISGKGSNMAALLKAAQDPTYPAEISLVLADRLEATGLQIAETYGIPTLYIDYRPFKERSLFEAALQVALEEHRIDLICLAGFLRILTSSFVRAWEGRLLNIHPSLLPTFKGLHSHRQALEAGVKIHGCTVHFVTPGIDEGPIVAQATVPVLAEDTEETLGARVLQQEHLLYPLALKWVAASLLDPKLSRLKEEGE